MQFWGPQVSISPVTMDAACTSAHQNTPQNHYHPDRKHIHKVHTHIYKKCTFNMHRIDSKIGLDEVQINCKMSNLCTSDLASVEMYIIYYLSKFGVNDSKDGKCIMLQKISTINSYCSFVIIITIFFFINEHNCILKLMSVL